MHEYILKEPDCNRKVVCVFIDLAKAFDTVNHDILLYKLDYSGSQTVVRKNFLSGARRYRPTVFTMLSDHDVTITSAVHFAFKLIGSITHWYFWATNAQ